MHAFYARGEVALLLYSIVDFRLSLHCTCPILLCCIIEQVPMHLASAGHVNKLISPLCVESSHGGDSEDSDWVPDRSGGKGGGDAAPPEDDSEDVADLLASAEEFIKNKKMRKPV